MAFDAERIRNGALRYDRGMLNRLHACALALLLLLSGCATSPPPTAPATSLLLISIDGLRPTDIDAAQMPALDALGNAYVRADGMRPSYPSLTFPNHYTLVTGLRPDHHGIVNNTMTDPALGNFRLSNREAVSDGRWWQGGVPVWVSVTRAGQRAATMFWPGSEAEIHGLRPWQWRPYDENVTGSQRVAQVLAWLAQPASARPRFVTLYFDEVDHASHSHGPDSAEARAARQQVDGELRQLFDGLRRQQLWASTNLVIVSDHGFASVPADHVVAMDRIVPRELAEAVTAGQVLGFRPQPGKTEEAEKRLLGQHDHYACWRKQALPPAWHYGSNPRIPPIVCQMDDGWDARWASRSGAPNAATRGSHGFDPLLPSMRASFIAAGPAFARGVRLPVFDNVDVYPLLMRLLELPAEPNDGEITPLLPALRVP